jgi:hypothetical protein
MGLGSNLNMTELYTRGGMQSDRGQSLVERHNERMQMVGVNKILSEPRSRQTPIAGFATLLHRRKRTQLWRSWLGSCHSLVLQSGLSL